MSIKRYTAITDTTIADAYKPNLVSKATGSNMGQADSLEIFKIYGQESETSVEESRILIKFPIRGTSEVSSSRTIKMDRDANLIPASGSVKFYLKMYNVRHHSTVPSNYKLIARPLTKDWEEGLGVDMDEYSDHGVASWHTASSTSIAEITRVTFSGAGRDTKTNYGAGSGDNYIAFYDTSGSQYNFWFNDGSGDTAPADGTTIEVDISGDSTAEAYADALNGKINAHSAFSSTRTGLEVYVTASTAGEVSGSVISGTLSNISLSIDQSGSDGTPWATAGGDPHASTDYLFSQDFLLGNEDLEVDVSKYVEDALAGTISGMTNNDYGLMLQLSASYISDANSYYTKKFSARSSEYFFKKPIIEARWNSSRKDDRSNFYYSSSLADATANENVLHMYNFINGKLSNIPGLTSDKIYVKLYASSGSKPVGDPLTCIQDSSNVTVVTGSLLSNTTGTYKVTFAIASQSYDMLHDVWFNGNDVFHTGTIYPKDRKNNSSTVVSYYDGVYASITNMKSLYYDFETPRFRVYTRKKGWNPTIYSKAVSEPELSIETSGSFSVIRTIDRLEVIGHDTGSDKSTELSYDASGSYFDLDMKLLEPGYSYGIKLAFYDDNTQTYVEHPDVYKFRVKKYES